MPRAWRIVCEGALHHVLSPDNEGHEIYFDDDDRYLFLTTLGQLAERLEVVVSLCGLIGYHYHLLLGTNRANLSKSMHWFGVAYTN